MDVGRGLPGLARDWVKGVGERGQGGEVKWVGADAAGAARREDRDTCARNTWLCFT